MPSITSLQSQLSSFSLYNKRVLVRVDYNVPTHNNTIMNDFRLQATMATIDYILERGGTVILLTHRGRPQGYDNNLSNEIFVSWFNDKGYSIIFEPSLSALYEKSLHHKQTILLGENLRFFPEELTNDIQFAHQLARLGDYYVNDAFGVLHRTDTSITTVPTLFLPEARTIGLLIERELAHLNRLLKKTQRPFIAILGGSKITDKIELIESLIGRVDTILLCPALTFTFLYAQGKSVGTSLIDKTLVQQCTAIMKKAEQSSTTIHFPIDYLASATPAHETVSIIDSPEIPNNFFGITVGPKTVSLYAPILAKAATIFFNGVSGFLTDPQTLPYTHQLLQAVNSSSAYSVLGGGDSIAVAQYLNCTDSIDFISTGGGATIAYISNKQLPGLQVFSCHS